jgi:hypothetical protein
VVEQVIRLITNIVVDVSIFDTRIQTRYLHMHAERMWGGGLHTVFDSSNKCRQNKVATVR